MAEGDAPGDAGSGGGRARSVVSLVRPQAEQLDEQAYLEANPDVARSGLAASDHYRLYGSNERRFQHANGDAMRAMRERKLRRIRFNRPVLPRDPGAAANFLTASTIRAFEIPAAPPVSASAYGGAFIEEVAAHPERICLDVGAGVRDVYAENIVYAEIYPSYTTDVVCVGEDLPFESNQFDYVLCMAVLEHTRRPWDVAREIRRVLKPGGKVLVDFPFLQGVHGYPHHYFNATPRGSMSLFEMECDILSSQVPSSSHPIHALWWLVWTWRNGLGEADRAGFDAIRIGDILARPADRQLEDDFCRLLDQSAIETIPAGSTMVARKRVAPGGAGVEAGGWEGMQGDRIAALEAEISALRRSHSWRLTEPLRALARRVRR